MVAAVDIRIVTALFAELSSSVFFFTAQDAVLSRAFGQIGQLCMRYFSCVGCARLP